MLPLPIKVMLPIPPRLQPWLRGSVNSSTFYYRSVSSQAVCVKANDEQTKSKYLQRTTPQMFIANPFALSQKFLQQRQINNAFALRCFSTSSRKSQAIIDESSTIATVATDVSEMTKEVVTATSETTSTDEIVLDFLPEKPTPLPESTDSVIQWVGDPPLETLGLASWWPTGRLQYFMEYMHVGYDIPWWGVIIATTVILRVVTFPLVVLTQRNVANMTNHNPEMMRLQQKITEARQRGDMYDVAKYGGQLSEFMKENKINPLNSVFPMLVQFPIFISMFLGLRDMANLPLESMMHGGLFWFEDLTIADPFYALPLLTSTSLFLQFKFAAEGASLETAGPVAKIVLKVLPFVLLPFSINFPAAITFYWFITNMASIIIAKIVRTKILRQKLGIPELVKWNKDNMPVGLAPKKGFRETFREMLDNAKVQAELKDRRIADQDAFAIAGKAKPKRTFKFDPTRPKV